MCEMRRTLPIVVLLATFAASAGVKSYLSGKLTDVVIKDMTFMMAVPLSTPSENLQVPLHMGVNYQFEISVDDVLYIGSCWSKAKQNYSADWVVKDPIEFRVEEGKLFLKRPVKGELRLALMGRFRTVSKKDAAGTEHQSLEPLPPFATRQIEPECH